MVVINGVVDEGKKFEGVSRVPLRVLWGSIGFRVGGGGLVIHGVIN